MSESFKPDKKYIVNLDILNTYNKNGCESCRRKFNLGETVVMACGSWADDCAKLIHENEAIFDKKTNTYFERLYYQSIH